MVFPERPAQPIAGQPMPTAGISSGPLQTPMADAPQRTATPITPTVSPAGSYRRAYPGHHSNTHASVPVRRDGAAARSIDTSARNSHGVHP